MNQNSNSKIPNASDQDSTDLMETSWIEKEHSTRLILGQHTGAIHNFGGQKLLQASPQDASHLRRHVKFRSRLERTLHQSHSQERLQLRGTKTASNDLKTPRISVITALERTLRQSSQSQLRGAETASSKSQDASAPQRTSQFQITAS